MAEQKRWGKVFFCPTPLGNLKDLTLRVLETLQQVDAVICEDTRVTLKLLNHYQIRKPLLSYRSQNRDSATRTILKLLRAGKNLAFVSDAGMPGIQDPGLDLVRVLRRENIDFEVLPGSSAFLLAVVYAAFPDPGFIFLGFLPRKGKERKKLLEQSLTSPFSVVLYESPYRLVKTLQDIQVMVEKSRRIVLLRELTKFHQEVRWGEIGDVLVDIASREVKGEIVLVVEGNKGEQECGIFVDRLCAALGKKGLSRKEIVEIVGEAFSVKRKAVERILETKALELAR